MSTNWNEGSSRNAGQGVPGSATDCSGWDADIANHLWSEGFSHNAGLAVPTSTTLCSEWLCDGCVSIAIQFTYIHEVDRKTVAIGVHSLIESIKALDPPLGLEYDERRSEENVSTHAVRIVLVPTQNVENVADRAWELLSRLRGTKLQSLCQDKPVAVSFECLYAA